MVAAEGGQGCRGGEGCRNMFKAVEKLCCCPGSWILCKAVFVQGQGCRGSGVFVFCFCFNCCCPRSGMRCKTAMFGKIIVAVGCCLRLLLLSRVRDVVYNCCCCRMLYRTVVVIQGQECYVRVRLVS